MKKVILLSIFCFISFVPAIAINKGHTFVQSSQSASKSIAAVTSENTQLSIPVVSGTWVGNIHGGNLDFKAALGIIQKGDHIECTLTSDGKEGKSKHYMRGHYDQKLDQFICNDIGVEKVSGEDNWNPVSFEQYVLSSVEHNNKLVGSCHQPGTPDTLWITLTKDVQTGVQNTPSFIPLTERKTSSEPQNIAVDPKNTSQSAQHVVDAPKTSSIPLITGTWLGTGHGNDPAFRITLQLQQDNETISGSFISDGRSGQCKRLISGSYDPKTNVFICKDIGIDNGNNTPAPGWMHCLIDRYEFQLTDNGKRLIGNYLSLACRDKAKFELGLKPLENNNFDVSDDFYTSHHFSTVENNLEEGGSITEAVLDYVKKIDNIVENHWFPPSKGERKNVRVHYTINKDGTFTNLKLDPSCKVADVYSEAAINAIQASTPYPKPSPDILVALRSDHIDLCTPFIMKGKVSPEAVSYMTDVERRIKSHWHPSHVLTGRRDLQVLFGIKSDGSVVNLRTDSSGQIDEFTEDAFDAVKLSSPFPPPPEAIMEGKDHVPIIFNFNYNKRSHHQVNALPLVLPMMLLGRGGFFWYQSSQN